MKNTKIIMVLLFMFVFLPVVAESGGHGLSEGYWFRFIATLFNMAVFFGLVFYLIKKPIAAALKNNQESIAKQLESAEAKEKESEKKLQEIEERMSGLKDEIEEILKKTDETANKEKMAIVEKAHEEARKIEAMAEKSIERKFKAARSELSTFATELAVEKAEEILNKQITEADIKKSMDLYIDELEASK